MSKRLLDASTKILKWYDDEDMSNPHSTEMWKTAYNELRDAVTELNERNSVDEGKIVCPYCNRTEPCKGSYPEGCFHPKGR